MSDVFTAAGSKLYIATTSTAPATYTESGFSALTYAEVGEITNLGEFGKSYNVVKHNPLNTRQTNKRKGSYDNGTLALTLGRVSADTGQAQLLTALDSDDSYPIKIVLQDGSIFYTTVQVISYKTTVGGVDDIVSASCDLEIDDAIIEVAPPNP